ncbi:putative dihydroxyacetone synthase [Naematelia encephala]|uniref:transketolase n=1 Tax=Naematelia encephala TaxID=71784 RepID=A0A1Y2AVA9_9TREE|nr:putative dihydroxyacetone synthase [Naematelia encephala]
MAPSIAAADVNAPEHGQGLKSKGKVTDKVAPPADEMLVLNTIRCLAADLCQQFKGGHPGTVMGAAAIGVALWRYQMRYNPRNSEWFGRDRFILSAGHACLLQYLMLHFSGYPAWTLDEIKNYHAPTMKGIAAGHPEIEYPGIEVTTGPLGQGIANAVGMALAGKNAAAIYNKEGYPIIDGKIWCFTGDGCLQEGVGQEAISMAGHWGLDNLILIYDNNSITVDGSIANCFTDDTSAKLKATGWEVIDVYDGSNDLAAILAALDKAKQTKGKPTFVNIRTIIGISSRKANTGPAHGQALGDDEVAYVKTQLGFNPDAKFVIPSEVRQYFAETVPRGQKYEDEWNDLFQRYTEAYPEEAKDLKRRINGKLLDGWEELMPSKDKLPQEPTPTRKSSGIMVQALAPRDKSIIAGSADLLESTFVSWKGMTEFQKPGSGLGDYSGRQIRYGIREFAMVAAGNGIAGYQKGMFLPIMSTFFMFWLYAAPAARMSALQKLRFIGIATHDAIGIGEDGPTHQPIALASFYRSLPDINFIRPADAEEVMGAWKVALTEEDRPSLFALSRQPVPLLAGSNRDGVAKGGYIVYGDESEIPDVTLLATGAEVARAITVAAGLSSKNNLKTRVVSMPSFKHFDAQPISYRRSTIPSSKSLVVAIEAWATASWPRYAHAGCHMHTFGHSAPQQILYEHFGFGEDNLVKIIGQFVDRQKGELPAVGEFQELLLGFPESH